MPIYYTIPCVSDLQQRRVLAKYYSLNSFINASTAAFRPAAGTQQETFVSDVVTARASTLACESVAKNLPTSPDGSEFLIVYHCHTDPLKGGFDRQVCIDRIRFAEDGTMSVIGPTTTEQEGFPNIGIA
jgi:hypothetical protein